MDAERKVWVGVDYLTASKLQDQTPLRTVISVGKLLESKGEEVTWKHGYTGLEICGGNGAALYRPYRHDSGGDVLVRIGGRALDWIRDRKLLSPDGNGCTDADICKFFVDHEFGATRLDATMDTNDPEVSPHLVELAIRTVSYAGHIQRAGKIDTWDLRKMEIKSLGETLTLGGRTSERYFRVYNKQAETLKKTGKDIGHMTRFELEHKGRAATRALRLIAAKGSGIIPGMFSGWINFKEEHDTTPRRDRRRNAIWWERLVGGHVPVILGLSRGISDPEKTVKWLKKVSKAIALAQDHGAMPEIQAAMEEKRRKVTPSEKLKWEHYAKCKKTGRMLEGWNKGSGDAK